ncbi:sodium-dependent phosphate transporter [Danaus plexippus plexippus]|uniref:Sodium-dependent phosphate transporter n=1 Tax=Danaus plexippus plexippus TaxID=278856 RepID=A0A212FBW4_DANPL|nr:sodium-dependent phosphate transporter [Danaus plexippus plexippus]
MTASTYYRLSISTSVFIIPQRYVFSIMALLAVANAYTMRVCLNLAITQMVKRTVAVEGDPNYDPDACPDPNVDTDIASKTLANITLTMSHYLRQDTGPVLFEWSEATQGLVLSAFYYGYVLTHIPGGIIAERYGGKWVLGLGLLSTALCTFITPFAVKTGGATALFILRVVEGFGEGPTMPGLMAMISKWAPKSERARIGAIVFGGAQIGNIAGSYFSGLIIHAGSWENVFYMFGGFGLAWFAIWSVLCYSTPNTHPFISDKEKKFLNENVQALIHSEKQILDPVPWKALLRSVPLWSLIIAGSLLCYSTPNTHPFISDKEKKFLNENVQALIHSEKQILDPVPWKALLRSVPLWSLIIAGIGHDWGYFTMVTDLPKYMTDVLKFNIKSAGLLSALPYVAMWIASFFFGLLCDFCTKRKYHSIQNARKIYTTIAATGPGICIILASYSGCDTTLAVFWFIAAMTLMGAYYSGMKINALDITPNYAGTTTAMVNGIAAISGIISPYLIGLLTPHSTLKEWRIAFWVCLAILVITNIIYLIFAKGEQQWWDDVKRYGYPENWKHGPLPVRQNDTEGSKSEKTKETK